MSKQIQTSWSVEALKEMRVLAGAACDSHNFNINRTDILEKLKSVSHDRAMQMVEDLDRILKAEK